jgi:hypothetical protein
MYSMLFGVFSLSLIMLAIGCGKSATQNSQQVAITDSAKSDAGAGAGSDDAKHAENIAAALAELSPEDRALVEKQLVCPVGGGKLGSMGAPIKVDVKGQSVFICCEGCREELLRNADEYLVKLKMNEK